MLSTNGIGANILCMAAIEGLDQLSLPYYLGATCYPPQALMGGGAEGRHLSPTRATTWPIHDTWVIQTVLPSSQLWGRLMSPHDRWVMGEMAFYWYSSPSLPMGVSSKDDQWMVQHRDLTNTLVCCVLPIYTCPYRHVNCKVYTIKKVMRKNTISNTLYSNRHI